MTRRESLKNLAYLLWIPFAWLVFKIEDRQKELASSSSLVRVGKDVPEGITFYGNVIVSKKNDKIHFLSSTCSHLGCRIQKEKQGILICPCHGSQYDIEGLNLRGPAVKPLENLNYHRDIKTGDYLVKIIET